jgi:tetratricopeptide (TPR) repeat protein
MNEQPIRTSSQESERASISRRLALGAVALSIITLVVYLPAIREGGWVWDDEQHVTDNPALRSLHGLRAIWFKLGATQQYYPMVFSSFWLEHRLWKLWATGYHIDNVLLHAASAVVLWRILLRLNAPGAWLAAAVFAVHPVHVESVAWVSERKNVLSGLLTLLSAMFYLRHALPELHGDPHKSARSETTYIIAFVLFVLALFSKTVACTLPGALLVIIWWKRGSILRRDLARIAPFVVVGVVLGLTTAFMERYQVRAVGDAFDLSAVDRVLIAGRAVWFYAYKLIWPATLIFSYPRWDVDPSRIWQFAFPVAAVALLLAVWMLRRRAALAALLYFGGALLPALGFVNVYPMKFSFVADHFQYMASIGLIALLVATGATVLPRAALPLVGSALIAILGVLTWRQCGYYRDAETLWRRTLALNPSSFVAAINLGAIEMNRNKPEAAIAVLEPAQRVAPNDAEVLFGLGNAYSALGRSVPAEQHLTAAVKSRPDFGRAHQMLGLEKRKLGDRRGAERHLRYAVALLHRDPVPARNLATFLVEDNRADEAIRVLRESTRTLPTAQSHFMLAAMLTERAATEEAKSELRAALRLDPRHGPARQLAEQLGLGIELRPELRR